MFLIMILLLHRIPDKIFYTSNFNLTVVSTKTYVELTKVNANKIDPNNRTLLSNLIDKYWKRNKFYMTQFIEKNINAPIKIINCD